MAESSKKSQVGSAPKRKIAVGSKANNSSSARLMAAGGTPAGGRGASAVSARMHSETHEFHLSERLHEKPRARVSLALKFALPVAAALLLVFFIMSFLLTRQMTTSVSHEIVKSGVAQVSMLSAIGTIIVERAYVAPDWPVQLGFITAEKFAELREKLNLSNLGQGGLLGSSNEERAQRRAERNWRRTLYAAQRGALLKKFLTSDFTIRETTGTVAEIINPTDVDTKTQNVSFNTQAVMAYILISDPQYRELYRVKAASFIIASADENVAPSGLAGLKISADRSWLPGGVDLVNYRVDNKNYTFVDDYITAGVAENPNGNIRIIVFRAPVFLNRPLLSAAEVHPPLADADNDTAKSNNNDTAANDDNDDETKKIAATPATKTMPRTIVGEVIVGINAQELLDAVSIVRYALIISCVLALLLAVATCLFVGYQVVKPVAVLLRDMDAVAQGNLKHKSNIKSNDEIGQLAQQFNNMTDKLQGAVANEKKMAAVESELDTAREIQKKLLPDKLPKIKGFDIFATYHPAKEVGGDYYDFLPIDNRHVGIIVADVSGKGIPGSMVMATTRTILRFTAAGNTSSADTLRRTNAMVAADIKRGMFVTAFYMVLDVVEKKLMCSSAGHNPMMILHANGNYELINPNGIALGFDKGRVFNRTIKEEEIQLRTGDRVIAYTDGVVEAMNLANEEYTDERFYEFVQKNYKNSSQEFVLSLLVDLQNHQRSKDTRQKKAEPHDDITIVAFRVE